MKRSENNGFSRRTQKDYSLSFKLQLVEEIEQCELTKSQVKLNMVFMLTQRSQYGYRKMVNLIGNIKG